MSGTGLEVDGGTSPPEYRSGYHDGVKRIRESRYFKNFRIEAPLPPSGIRRYLVLGWLVLGALVALLVPVVLAVLIWGIVTGQDQRPAADAPPSAPAPITDGTPGTR